MRTVPVTLGGRRNGMAASASCADTVGGNRQRRVGQPVGFLFGGG